jgi:hypothetical protein
VVWGNVLLSRDLSPFVYFIIFRRNSCLNIFGWYNLSPIYLFNIHFLFDSPCIRPSDAKNQAFACSRWIPCFWFKYWWQVTPAMHCDCLSISFLSSISCGIHSASTYQLSFINDINIHIWTSGELSVLVLQTGVVVWSKFLSELRMYHYGSDLFDSHMKWWFYFAAGWAPFCAGSVDVEPGRCHATQTARNGVAPEVLLETKILQATHKLWSPAFKKACGRQKVTPTIAALAIVVSGGVCHTTRPCLGSVKSLAMWLILAMCQ